MKSQYEMRKCIALILGRAVLMLVPPTTAFASNLPAPGNFALDTVNWANHTPVATLVAFNAGVADATGSISGADVYKQSCIACHGANGKGLVPGTPDFTEPNGRLSQSDEVLIHHIMQGFQSPGSQMPMPPKGGNSKLTEADAQAVLIYMRESFGN